MLSNSLITVLCRFSLLNSGISIYSGGSSLTATGTIDGKFDCGYLVIVKLGSQTLSGVLYHPDRIEQVPSPAVADAIEPYTPKPARKRRSKRKGDPNYPKPNRSGLPKHWIERH